MNASVGRTLLAILVAVAGFACWMLGQMERRVSDADERLTTLRYQTVTRDYDIIEQSAASLRRFPWGTTALLADIRHHRSEARYWLRDYVDLAAKRDAEGSLIEKDPETLFLAANAEYRTSQAQIGDPLVAGRKLDAVVAAYGDALKADPGNIDASYNYEYVARVRDSLAKRRKAPKSDHDTTSSGRIVSEGGTTVGENATAGADLPVGPTLHGTPGAPPARSSMKPFYTTVPMAPDERDKTADKGIKQKRKG